MTETTGKAVTYDSIQYATERALRPRHTSGEVGSPEWWRSCDDAFRHAMIEALWQYKAERDARKAS
jgi:hypothetical protein